MDIKDYKELVREGCCHGFKEKDVDKLIEKAKQEGIWNVKPTYQYWCDYYRAIANRIWFLFLFSAQ